MYVRLIFQSGVPIKNAVLIFVHKEDKNEHIMFGFKSGDEDTPIQPTMGSLLDLAVTITKNTKPGEYLLEKINFETYSGRTLDPQGELPGSRFEVIPEHEVAPKVEEVVVLTEAHWRAVKRNQ